MASDSIEHELNNSTTNSKENKKNLKKKTSLANLFTTRLKKSSKPPSGLSSPQTQDTLEISGKQLGSNPSPPPPLSAGPGSLANHAVPTSSNGAASLQRRHIKASDVKVDLNTTAVNVSTSDAHVTGSNRTYRNGRNGKHQPPAFPRLHSKSHGSLCATSSDSQWRGLLSSPYKTNIDLSRAGPGGSNIAVDQAPARIENASSEGPVKDLQNNFTSSSTSRWHRIHETNDNRASSPSALSHTSNGFNASSSGRSSGMSRRTSLGASSVDVYKGSNPMNVDMTVDDAINMYVDGFSDDAVSIERTIPKFPIAEIEKRRSARIAEAINDSIGPELLSAKDASSAGSHSSAAIISGAVFEGFSEVPLLVAPTSTRDQYGFFKASHHIIAGQYDAWNRTYLPNQERQSLKWQSYMRKCKLNSSGPHDFPQRCAKTQQYVRKGIPPAWRGAAWFHYAGGKSLIQKHPHLYGDLLARSGTSELSDLDKEVIERDLHRTFPDNVRYKPENSRASRDPIELPLLSSLRNVLRAFSLHALKIGYCQSLNFICGLLLLFLPEEKAFWMLHIITTEYVPGSHEMSLEGTNVDLWVLMIALKESMPGVWAKVAAGENNTSILSTKLPPISLCTTSWFMSLFIGTLPIESVLRVWDVLFYEGSKTLFRVALAIFKIGEERLRGLTDSMDMFQVVQSLPRELLDVDLLMSVAFRRGRVSQDWVENKRRERRQWYARESAKLFAAMTPDVSLRESEATKSRRAESLWRRKRK
ncbi:MAG: hypothetical protein Q9195_004392 [Heterodermia aff. obscurata]